MKMEQLDVESGERRCFQTERPNAAHSRFSGRWTLGLDVGVEIRMQEMGQIVRPELGKIHRDRKSVV